MKSLKNSLGIFAAIMGITMAFAFTAPETKTNVNVNPWFKYTGGGETDPLNYIKMDVSEICAEGTYLCAIQAEEDGSSQHPTQAGVTSPDAEALQLSSED